MNFTPNRMDKEKAIPVQFMRVSCTRILYQNNEKSYKFEAFRISIHVCVCVCNGYTKSIGKEQDSLVVFSFNV